MNLLKHWRVGLLGVLAFSLTVPATRFAVAALDPTIVGLGRALVAAALAAALLVITRQRRPTREQITRLLIVASGVILGFPFLSARSKYLSISRLRQKSCRLTRKREFKLAAELAAGTTALRPTAPPTA